MTLLPYDAKNERLDYFSILQIITFVTRRTGISAAAVNYENHFKLTLRTNHIFVLSLTTHLGSQIEIEIEN